MTLLLFEGGWGDTGLIACSTEWSSLPSVEVGSPRTRRGTAVEELYSSDTTERISIHHGTEHLPLTEQTEPKHGKTWGIMHGARKEGSKSSMKNTHTVFKYTDICVPI